MKKIALALCCITGLAVGGVTTIGTYQYAIAQGDSDAGLTVSSASDAGPVAAVTEPAGPPSDANSIEPKEAAKVVDLVSDPGGYAQDVLSAYRAAQYAFFVVLVLFGISTGILWLDSKYKFHRLKAYRRYIVFGSSVLGGAIVSLAALEHIDLRVVAGAIAAALMLELRGKGAQTMEGRAKSMYEAYAGHTGWKSAVTGADLPQWADVPQAVRDAWIAVAKAA